jgi:hypothetical protein
MSISVDTSAWYAGIFARDPEHLRVVGSIRAAVAPLVTTDFVIDQTLTLLRARGHRSIAATFGRRMFDLREIKLHYVTPEEVWLAWEIFRDHPEHAWSFTDCTSFVVMQNYHIREVLTLDRHFAEFGTFEIVP